MGSSSSNSSVHTRPTRSNLHTETPRATSHLHTETPCVTSHPRHRNAVNVIGNGVVVHVPSLFEEIKELEAKGVDVSVTFIKS
jgi:adenylosuccinate synthase